MNYKKIADKALKANKKNGSVCILKRVIDEVYNPETNEYDRIEKEFKGYATQDSFSIENIDGTNIKFGDVKLMAVLNEKPLTGDTIEFGKNKYTVVTSDVVSPDGVTDIYYEVQCR